MSVFQAGSISADPISQAVIFLVFAELLRVASPDAEPRTTREGLGLVALCAMLGFVKPGYAPLALAALALPKTAFPGRRRWAWACAMPAAALLATLAWTLVVQAAQQPALTDDADMAGQLRHVLAHPMSFPAAAITTTVALTGAWLEGMVGTLGHLDVEIPLPATWLAWVAVLAGAALGGREVPGRALRATMALGFLATAATVLLMAYLGWTPVGHPHVLGVQGRYFLLMLPFAIGALPALPNPAGERLRPALVWTLAGVLAISAVELVTTYYEL